jgi:tetratricopeptide (TPR) repeat protein
MISKMENLVMNKNKTMVVVFVGLVGLVMCGAVAAEDAESLLGEYDKAIGKYRQTVAVATDWSDSKHYAIEAQERLAIANVSKGDDAQVQSELEQLVAKHKDKEFLPPVVFHVGEEYWFEGEKMRKAGDTEGARGLYEKSLAIFDFIIKELEPEKERLGSTYMFRAACYHKLGQLEKSIEDYQMVVDYWPGHRWVATAQYMVGNCYKELLEVRIWAMDDDGAMAAEAGMEKAYKATIENYPDKSVSLYACKQMGQHCYDQDRCAEAVKYLEKYQSQKPDNVHVLQMLEECHEQLEKNSER